jgi:hypothetical protein
MAVGEEGSRSKTFKRFSQESLKTTGGLVITILLAAIAFANAVHAADVECDVKSWRDLVARSKGLILAASLKPGMSYKELTTLLGEPDNFGDLKSGVCFRLDYAPGFGFGIFVSGVARCYDSLGIVVSLSVGTIQHLELRPLFYESNQVPPALIRIW